MINDRQIRAIGGTRKQAAKLVTAGLWTADDAPLSTRRYFFNDWSEYQPSRAEVTSRRRDDAERKRAARASSAAKQGKPGNVQPDVQADGARTPADVSEGVRSTRPGPAYTRPDQEQESAPRERAASPAKGNRLPEDWEPSGAAVSKMRAEFPRTDFWQETAKFRDYWAGVPGAKGQKLDWDATWRNWIRRANESPTRPANQAAMPRKSTTDQRVNEVIEIGRGLAEVTPLYQRPVVGLRAHDAQKAINQ
ncbi:hypothetical protein [Nocardia fluminea]|uniref:hypothetical protein n=1 Tax=Nocardia fluminea TaxID=134984 RepID=UPI003D0F2249